MTRCFGIDLGTTNSVICELVNGRPVAIPVHGSPIVPSVVLYQDGRIIVGREARNLELMHPEQTIRSVKRKMGQEHLYKLANVEVSPEQVSAEILRELKRGAEAHTGTSIQDVVITVPAYFDDAQRRATLKAGELSGMNVLRLLNEPTSASLVFEQAGAGVGAERSEYVLVYDLGGGTFDVSVLEVFGGVREVKSTTGNTHLGGDDFDELILRSFLDHLRMKHAVDLSEDPPAMARLRRAAEEAKIALSADTEVHVKQEFLARGAGKDIHLDLHLTRREFEQMVMPLLMSTMELTAQAIKDAGLTERDINHVCLVGGSTRIPMVRTLLEERIEAPVHEEIDPDLAVGLGAAIQSGLLSGASVERILVDVASHSLGIRVLGNEDDDFDEKPDTFAPVLHRNTVLPAQRTEEFYTMVDDQERLNVEVFQGESRRVSRNTPVGSFLFDLRPGPAHSPVRVEFAYDLNGVVKVSVSQPGTDNKKTVALSVADAAKGGPGKQLTAMSPVERKARELLEKLSGHSRQRLEEMLNAFLSAHGDERESAEEELLDFFLDHEDAG